MGQAGAPGNGVLDDHRRLAKRTVVTQAAAGLVIAVALLAGGRATAVPGLCAGVLCGAVDAVLLVRGLDRFGRHQGLSARALVAGLMSRWVAVGSLVGLLMSARAMNPLAVISGFLLFPVALVAVSLRANRIAEVVHAGR